MSAEVKAALDLDLNQHPLVQQLQDANQQLQHTCQHLQQSIERLEQTSQQQQQTIHQLQQELRELKQHREEKQEEKKQPVHYICSIGCEVHDLPAFEQPSDCYGIALSGGRLYLSHHHVVDVVDATSGGRLTRYGTLDYHGKSVVGQPPQFYYPWGVAVDEARERVYVADECNHCVVVVRLCDGIVEAVWGEQGFGQHQFNGPRGLAYCPSTDQVYVVDRSNHCVKVLRGSDGQCVQILGTGRHQMRSPVGVTVDSRHVFITDTGNHRVLVYTKQSGTFLYRMQQGRGSGNNQFNNPYSVSVDSEAGVVYVADSGNQRVCVYRIWDGSYVRHFHVLQANNTNTSPYAVMWDGTAGLLYVTTCDSSTMCVYPC